MFMMGRGFEQTTVAQQTHGFMTSCAKSMALCAESAVQANMVKVFSAQVKKNKTPNKVKDFKPNPLPCLGNLKLVKDMKLAKDFQQFAHYLPWGFSPRTLDQGKHVAIMDFRKMFEMGKVTAGLMYVDVYSAYPEHNHPPDEIYFLISGTAKWRWGGHRHFRSITAGNLIYNYPYNWHGVKAGPTPVLALYLQARR
ncbi:dimethylsulfonioproprionate lyase family protein [Candidatus Spongiihabitans sp.]|uniref:dimethylsulfonioproprionate lyase family protein n=1 Tax=Candidatus Spongiihabitans sp. TaxID=3101308 RepID=UPI003C6FC453